MVGHKAHGCFMERPDQFACGCQRFIRTPRLRIWHKDEWASGVHRSGQGVARYVFEDLTSDVIESKRLRSASEPSGVKMGKVRMDSVRPRPRRSMNCVPDPDYPNRRAPADQRYLFVAHGAQPKE